MSIGARIKQLRREKDITQEQLAAYLGITSRAVSQWETDRTAPDIAQLPALCHVFDVSSDVLLGIDIEKNNEEIKKYLTDAAELGYRGKGAERTALLREANRKFPRDYKIMERLADSLVCEYSRKGIREYDEVFALCRRILAECTDSTIRYEAIDTLGTAYGYAGKTDEMVKLAREMPRTHFSYENFMMHRWKGDADFEEFGRNCIAAMEEQFGAPYGYWEIDFNTITRTEEIASIDTALSMLSEIDEGGFAYRYSVIGENDGTGDNGPYVDITFMRYSHDPDNVRIIFSVSNPMRMSMP